MSAGNLLRQERYPSYYGWGITASNFFTNPLISRNPDDRVAVAPPSAAKVHYTDRVHFPEQERGVETRIFTGVIEVGLSCDAGEYIFQVTSDDAAHLLIDGAVLVDVGGEHAPTSKWAKTTIQAGKPYKFEVRPCTVDTFHTAPRCLLLRSLPARDDTTAEAFVLWTAPARCSPACRHA